MTTVKINACASARIKKGKRKKKSWKWRLKILADLHMADM